MKTKILYVDGIHCSSCESIIESKLKELPNIDSAEVSQENSTVTIKYKGAISTSKINKLFEKNNYIFSEEKIDRNKASSKDVINSFLIAIIIIISFFILEKSGVSRIAQVSSSSSLSTFFMLGLIASISSCAALVGGIILSLSKKWDEEYLGERKFSKRIQPQILFNSGRLISYSVLGGALGAMGGKIIFSPTFSSILVLSVSVVMIVIGFQMLDVKWFKKIRIALPKFITKKISNTSYDSGHKAPFVIGALTFFLPCGFTITAQGFALLSGNFISGSLIMLMFALGTTPALLAIGLTSVKFISNHKTAIVFSKAAGVLIVFFALFNINAQLTVFGYSNAGDLINNPDTQKEDIKKETTTAKKSSDLNISGLPIIKDGKQIVKMTATASGYSPSYIKVRKDIPVEWQIEDKGTSGCTNAVISRSLFEGQIELETGKVSVKEFLPTKIGKFKFSCWMGMVSGTIEVVE